MNILVVGDDERLAECRAKFGSSHDYVHASDHHAASLLSEGDGTVFDFLIADHPNPVNLYAKSGRILFFNTAKTTLRKLVQSAGIPLPHRCFGFNGLPTFLGSPALEIAMLPTSDHERLRQTCEALGCEFIAVKDQVGLVSPRVISMIINEAYYTVEDSTASRMDIDLAMKLGTNYPYGPFEWCDRIGIQHVYELLEALFLETKDDCYKICPLLRDEYLKTRR